MTKRGKIQLIYRRERIWYNIPAVKAGEKRKRRTEMNDKRDPIGVFDSGLGGINTLGEMRRLLPGEHFIYYGDMGNAPYGTKTPGV